MKLVGNLPGEDTSYSVFISTILALPVRWEEVDLIISYYMEGNVYLEFIQNEMM